MSRRLKEAQLDSGLGDDERLGLRHRLDRSPEELRQACEEIGRAHV